MFRRILVTLGALFLINASSPDATPHTIDVTVSHLLNYRSSHVFLGIAVLGHNVTRIESGWLVKQSGGGWLHIDWTTGGKWEGLTRSEEGPHDVSPVQLEKVTHVIESLGFAPSAIHAWRVAAPVGYDGFGEGDKVLTIGEILVDLGTVDEARRAIDRWWDVISKDDDPFDRIPLTNVRYSGTLYFKPDCSVEAQKLHGTSVAETQTIVAAVASSTQIATHLTDYRSNSTDAILCPENREPYFMRTDVGPPWMYDFELSGRQGATVSYVIGGRSKEHATPPVPDDLSKTTLRFEFDLPEPYIATVGSNSANVQPDAFVLHFIYDLGAKSRKGYDADLGDAQAHVAKLQGLVENPNDIIVQRSPGDDRNFRIDAFLLVRGHDPQMVKRIAAAGTRDGHAEDARYTAFVANCDAALKKSTLSALAQARHKAGLLARIMHVKIRNLSAARIDKADRTDTVCGFDPRASLSTLASQTSWNSSGQLNWLGDILLSTSVDAAWAFDGIPNASVALARTQYESEVRGKASIDTLELRALTQAAHQAIVDNPQIASVYEMEPLTDRDRDGSGSASERIIVLRRP